MSGRNILYAWPACVAWHSQLSLLAQRRPRSVDGASRKRPRQGLLRPLTTPSPAARIRRALSRSNASSGTAMRFRSGRRQTRPARATTLARRRFTTNSAGWSTARRGSTSASMKITGQDFDGDDYGEVVFETDSGGGNHCCWAYNVISLFPRPHKLFDIAMEGAVQFEKDDAGKMVIWERVAAPDVFNGPMAGRPFVERVFHVRDGKLTDATPEFCARIFGVNSRYNRGWQRDLSTENIAKFASLADPQNQQDAAAANDAVEFIGRSLLERAYQRLLCGDADAAIADLNLWPAASRAKTKAAFASQVKDDFPVFAERLAAEGGSKCRLLPMRSRASGTRKCSRPGESRRPSSSR